MSPCSLFLKAYLNELETASFTIKPMATTVSIGNFKASSMSN
jgi:hypothetical protein